MKTLITIILLFVQTIVFAQQYLRMKVAKNDSVVDNRDTLVLRDEDTLLFSMLNEKGDEIPLDSCTIYWRLCLNDKSEKLYLVNEFGKNSSNASLYIQPHVFRGGVTYYRSYVDSVAETVFQIGRIECNVYMKRHPYEWYQITIPVKVDVLPRVPKLRVLDMILDTEFPNYDNYDATFEIIATGDYREGTLYVLPYVGYDVFFPNVEMPYVAKACVSIGESVVVSLGNNYGHTDSNIIRIDDSLTSILDVNLSNGVQITQNGRGIDIMVSDSRITKLSVFDLKGKEVYQKNVVEKGSLSIDLQKGIYILVFKDTMNNKTRKKINII